MDSVFKLAIEISTKEAVAEIQNLNKEFEKASQAAKKVGDTFSKSFDGIGSKIGEIKDSLGDLTSGSVKPAISAIGSLTTGLSGLALAGTAVGLAVVGIGAALSANTRAINEEADAADELAQKYGITIAQLEAFKLIAAENAGTVEGLVSVYDKLQRALSKQDDENLKITNSFRRLGIAQEEIANLSKEQIAGVVLRNWEAFGKSAEATASVINILGANFRSQIPAIKEAAANFDDYQQRIRTYGAVVTPELVEAGGKQEKAFSNLGLAVKGLQISLAQSFTGMTTDIAQWAADSINSLRKLKDEFKDFVGPSPQAIENLKKAAGVSAETFAAIQKSAAERTGGGPGADAKLSPAQKLFRNPFEVAKRETDYNKEVYQSLEAIYTIKKKIQEADDKRGKDAEDAAIRAKKLPDLQKPSTKKTDEDRAIEAFDNALKNSEAEFQKFIAIGKSVKEDGISPVNEELIKLTYKLFEAGKGFISLDDASVFAKNRLDDIRASIQAVNDVNLAKGIAGNSANLQNQIETLSQTTEIGKTLVGLRQNLDKITGKEFGLQTAEQVKLINSALADTEVQLGKIRDLKIGNSVTESLKDLAEQSRLLDVQLANFYETNRDALNSVAQSTSALYKQIDPEGRGKNISEKQKEQIRLQLESIEVQKQQIELNKKIDDSWRNLGDAVTNNILRMADSSKKLKLALVQLAALEIFKRGFGGSTGGIAGEFFTGLLGGLSGRASGGYVAPGQTVVVGEERPELFTAGATGGYVTPNVPIYSPSTSRRAQVVFSPNLIIQGSVTGDVAIQDMFDQFAKQMATEVVSFVVSEKGERGILSTR